MYEGVVDPQILNKLQLEAVHRHRLKGAYTLNPIPIACFRAKDDKQFRQFKQDIVGLTSWIWDTPFGRVTSFRADAPAKGKKNKPRARLFVPTDEAFARKVYAQGRLVFFVTYQGKRTDLYEVDFVSGAKGGIEALSYIDTHNRSPIIYHDPGLAFWLVLASQANSWKDELKATDRLSINWAKGAHSFFDRWQTLFNEDDWFEDGQLNLGLAQTEDIVEIGKKFPYTYSILEAIAQPRPSFDTVLGLMKQVLIYENYLEELIWNRLKIPGNVDGLSGEMFRLFDQFFVAMQLTTEATKSGTRRLWIDAQTKPMQIKYLELDAVKLAQASPRYWYELEQFSYPFDIGRFLTAEDAPVPCVELWEATQDLHLEASIDEANAAYTALLEDAREHAQWSIPWGARVQFDVPEFPFIELYPVGEEVYAVFRNSQNQFFIVAMGMKSGHAVMPTLLKNLPGGPVESEEWPFEHNDEAKAALLLLLAAIVRDFMVVEERESVFSTKRFTGKKSHNNRNPKELTVIYLPRIRYKDCRPADYLNEFPKERRRAKHKVRPHIRKVNKASKEQLWLAFRYNMDVPRGHTFIRPHERGVGKDIKRKSIYRSRSASQLIYNTVEIGGSTEIKWFDFERDVVKLMKALGYDVKHQATNNRGDGGVDVYAYDSKGDEIWAIQCKCYAAHHKVGPDVIRALYGSMASYPEGTKGMVVTTSNFTSGAEEEAQKLSITLIDGSQFVDLAASI
ncbi:restriction endonuclease [Gammaproteobacteria bacterium]|nr:restriction endonuclease [Gammaproteobacteria bacterium]